MIINEIHIEGFGVFNGLSLKGLRNGVNILLGENEAGKSTLLQFVRFTLFGNLRGKKDQKIPPLRGGNLGGRIKAKLSAGNEVIFERQGDKSISLNSNGKKVTDEQLWFQYLGTASSIFFNNVYAFSLTELASMESLSKSGAEDKIFSIGAGLKISINDVIRDIQKNADELYIPKGTTKEINKILTKINEKTAAVEEIQQNLPRYKELTGEVLILSDSIREIDDKLNHDRLEKIRLENFLKCYESYVSLVRSNEELNLLPEFRLYPADGIERLNGLEKEEKELSDEIAELQNGADGIELINAELNEIVFNRLILKEKNNVDFLKTNLEKYKLAIKDKGEYELELNRVNRHITERIKTIDSGWSEINITGFENIKIHQDKVLTFKQMLDEIKLEKSEKEIQKRALEASSGWLIPKNALALLSLVFILLSIPAFFYSWYIPGVTGVVIAILIFSTRKYIIKESPLDNVVKKLGGIIEREEQKKLDYGDYLEKIKLNRNLQTDTALDILKLIETLKNEIAERDNKVHRQTETKDPFINKFENTAESLINVLNNNVQGSDVENLVNNILGEYDFAEEKSKIESDLNKKLSGKNRELTLNQNALNLVQQTITEMLISLEAENRNDFRAKYEENSKVKLCTNIRDTAKNTIEIIFGIDSSDDVVRFLNGRDQDTLREEIIKLESAIESANNELGSKNKELGEKKNEIRRIGGESVLADRLTRLETEKQRLADAYKEWVTYKTALKVLSDVREKYEREKQPEIIRNSGKYFSKITSGRYARINVSMGTQEISIFDSTEAEKNIDQLSRGTREQLLISMRLGFIEEYETRSEPLPIIMDEVLVNFDHARAKKTAEIFQEFGKNRQILFFTCHPYVIDYFKKSSVNLIDLKKLVNDTQAI